MTFIKKFKNGLTRKRNRNTSHRNDQKDVVRNITLWQNITTAPKEYSFTRYVNR